MARVEAFAFPGRQIRTPPILLICLPKSGSVYIQRALRRTLQVKVHHIGAPGMSGAWFGQGSLCRFEQGNVVSREHMQPRAVALNVLAAHGVRQAVLHVRDPRAAIVSWTRHMDRVLKTRGLRSVELFCERAVPQKYVDWTFAQRVDWQVANQLPDFVQWIEDWLKLVETSRDIEFLVTDYRALSDDARGLITRILDFYKIAYEPSWITMPVVRVGKNNIYTAPEGGAAGTEKDGKAVLPAWAAAMSPETLRAANAQVPDFLLERFGWTRI